MEPLEEFGRVVAPDGETGGGARDVQNLDIAAVKACVDAYWVLAHFTVIVAPEVPGKPENSAWARRGAA